MDLSTADKDSFKEIVDFVNAVDLTNDNALAAAVASLATADSDESAARVAADSSLTTRLAAEEGARADADASIDVVMAAMQADIDQNELDSDNAEASLQTRLAAEESARAAGDASIDVVMAAMQADIDQNEQDSDDAEASLTTRLGAEEVARAAADASLVVKYDAAIATENAARLAQEALVGADLAEIHGKWQSFVHAPAAMTVASGHIVDIVADGLQPMSELAYVSVNGMIMSPMAGGAGDYNVTLDGNGNIIEIVFTCPIMGGDRIAYYGQKAYSLVS